MAYEALNNAARMKKNFIIVLNDNKMSISENVGGMSRYLNGLRTGSGYNDLKKSVADALDRIPVVGTAMIDKIKRTKNSIKQLFIPVCCLKIWALPIWARWTATISRPSARC